MNSIDTYYDHLHSLPEVLRNIVLDHWDLTGRPIHENTLSLVTTQILLKNTKEGYEGFKQDMNLIFSEQPINEQTLITFYTSFIEGAKYISKNITTTKNNLMKM